MWHAWNDSTDVALEQERSRRILLQVRDNGFDQIWFGDWNGEKWVCNSPFKGDILKWAPLPKDWNEDRSPRDIVAVHCEMSRATIDQVLHHAEKQGLILGVRD